MSRPTTLEDTIRAYDKAIFDWFEPLECDYGLLPQPHAVKEPRYRSVLRLIASPARAFAEVKTILVEQKWVEGDTEEQRRERVEEWKVPPLPMISIQRVDEQPDPMRSTVPVDWTFKDGTLTASKYPAPTPWNFTYDIEIWSLYRPAAVHIREWIMAQLGEKGTKPFDFLLSVEHDSPWGTQVHTSNVSGFADSSDLEVESDYRFIRWTFTITVQGWLFKPKYPDDDGTGDGDGGTGGGSPKLIKDIQLCVEGDDRMPPDLLEEDPRLDWGIIGFPQTQNLLHVWSKTNYELWFVAGGDAAILERRDVFSTFSPRPATPLIDWIDEPVIGYSVLEMTFTDDAADALSTRPVPVPDTSTPISFRTLYRVDRAGVTVYLDVLDKDGNITQTHVLPYTALRWCQCELFALCTTEMSVRFRTSGACKIVAVAPTLVEHFGRAAVDLLTDWDMSDPGVGAWTPGGAAVLSKTVDGLQVSCAGAGDGVLQQAITDPYTLTFLSVGMLNTTGLYRILLEDAAGVEQTYIDIDSTWKDVGIVQTSDSGGAIRFRLVKQDAGVGQITLSFVSLRMFSARVVGSYAPLPKV